MDDKNPGIAERQVGMLRAVPLKRSLRNDARKLDLREAVVEIVDNAIDNFAKQEKLGRTGEQLQVGIQMNEDNIVIRENSGGVTPEDLQAFVQVGALGERAGAPHIGVWGAGQKVALAALGSDVVISTRYWDPRREYEVGDGKETVRTEKVVLRMDPHWWVDEENWDVPVFLPERDLPSGETLYEISKLNRRVDEDVIRELRTHLADLYGDILQKEVATFILGDSPVQGESLLSEESLVNTFAFPPGMEPSWHEFPLEAEVFVRDGDVTKAEMRKLRMRILVGLTPHLEKQSGVYMFGVPEAESGATLGARLFARSLQNEDVGYSEAGRSLLRRGDPTLGRLRIYVVFYGESENIPWGMPGSAVKWDYYGANPFGQEIKDRIKEVARPYVRFTQKALEIDVLPYSKEWNAKSEAERKALIKRTARLTLSEELDDPEIRPKIRTLLRSEFKKPEFHEWNHSKLREGPPETLPAFDENLSKKLAGTIQGRTSRLKELAGNDPVEAVETLVNTLEEIRAKDEEGWTGDGNGNGKSEEDKTIVVSVRVPQSLLARLREVTGTTNRSEAILAAIRSYLGIELEE